MTTFNLPDGKAVEIIRDLNNGLVIARPTAYYMRYGYELYHKASGLSIQGSYPVRYLDQVIAVGKAAGELIDWNMSADQLVEANKTLNLAEKIRALLWQYAPLDENLEPIVRSKPAPKGEPYTKVIFRKWRTVEQGGDNDRADIIAIMPELAASSDIDDCESYEHIGQHGACNPYWLISGRTRLADGRMVHRQPPTLPAMPEEYAELKEELEQIGYRVKVIKTGLAGAYINKRRAMLESYTNNHP